jgi:nucleotide-binding universal stress UspA family protein
MKKILFPTDFSDASKNAFIYALKLADSINAEIVTLNVYQLPQASYIDVTPYLQEIYEVTELSNFENYKDEIPVLRKIAEDNDLGHIKISNVLVMGNLIQETIEIAKKEHIDYVVMGTKGATGLKETFLGTITTKVMNDTEAVVLAIPEHCKYQPIKKILFLTEYIEEDLEVLKKIMSLAKVFQAHIDCLFVKVPHRINYEENMEDWKPIIKNHDVALHSIAGTDVEGIILDFIDVNKINMVAMHVHHRNFFEKLFQISLSKKLSFHLNVPILAIHE